ncbi:MAG: tricarballylate utilization 4Fe-4S protein TcuB [Burkholderiales bacterium]|nr:MAG: tricarballylate utilization 4Fe-4S protein TcuB [Burkholderiales bacterium]
MSTIALNQLIQDAAGAAEQEVARQMQICNACRYCEGFCAVFPAMTRRLDFTRDDVHYLANLCHNCGACLHACQYAPPHEFAVNVPQAMAKVRVKTYQDYAWPQAFAGAYQRNGLVLSLALAFGLALFFLIAAMLKQPLWHAPSLGGAGGNFYAVFPHSLMANVFGAVFGFALLALGIGLRNFWKTQNLEQKQSIAGIKTARAAINLGVKKEAKIEATQAVLSLKYLDGGHGEGCHNEDEAWTKLRRVFHHFTFYGFMLCLASTSVATLYHYAFNWVAPYGYASLPKLLGITGGIGLLVGPAGLFWLKTKRHPLHGDKEQNPMDYGFIALLFAVSLTGLALMLWRDSSAMALLLCIHFGSVMAFFLTMPYGKMAHGFYRCAALLKFAIEKRQPSNLKLSAD